MCKLQKIIEKKYFVTFFIFLIFSFRPKLIVNYNIRRLENHYTYRLIIFYFGIFLQKIFVNEKN